MEIFYGMLLVNVILGGAIGAHAACCRRMEREAAKRIRAKIAMMDEIRGGARR